MGVRSMCTEVITPDLRIVLDPSAALSRRSGLDPHPTEYRRLLATLEQVFRAARRADVLFISHYHYDHVRPGFTDYQYNMSCREELLRMFEGKHVLAKDNRSKINPSQRRRGYYFEKDVGPVAVVLEWCDGRTFEFGGTRITVSPPLPHGPEGTRLGYVVAATVSHGDSAVVYAPDVQGPVSSSSLLYLERQKPDLCIVGGPPVYLSRFTEESRSAARESLIRLATVVPVLVVDHHLLRSADWETWLRPVVYAASQYGHHVYTLAHLAGQPPDCLESRRADLYAASPPPPEFTGWTALPRDAKSKTMPPVGSPPPAWYYDRDDKPSNSIEED